MAEQLSGYILTRRHKPTIDKLLCLIRILSLDRHLLLGDAHLADVMEQLGRAISVMVHGCKKLRFSVKRGIHGKVITIR